MSSKLNPWSDDEIELLHKFWPSSEYSKIIGRSKRACDQKAKSLGIKKYSIYNDPKEFKKLIESSKSRLECIRKLGLSEKSGNYQTINKYIKKFDLNIDHFRCGFGHLQPTTKAIDLKDVLIENCYYSRSSLKKRLYDEGLKLKQCEICGQGEDWNGTKLVHILDHINGNCYDNRIENLRIVCPNCNSSLETSNGKNKKRKTNCERCGCDVSKKSKHCVKCRSILDRTTERPDIEILKHDVNENGYSYVGKKYGVSDNTIRKWIKSTI